MLLTRKDNSRRRIASVGMYDGVHAGHRFLINFMQMKSIELGLTPAVITFAAHPLATVAPERAPKMILSPADRIEMLQATPVDDIILLDFNYRMSRMSARSFLKMIHSRWAVDALVVGFNHRLGRDRADGIDAYTAIGKEIGMTIIPAPEATVAGAPVSSSIIRAYISSGNMEAAAAALSRPYTIRGTVTHGSQLGRTIGFPTANIAPDFNTILPAIGVYAAVATTPDGIRHPAMVNIGTRPTVDTQATTPTIEAHILDYDGYLYDDIISLEFISRIRDEKPFPSVEALAKQLAKDAASCRRTITRAKAL